MIVSVNIEKLCLHLIHKNTCPRKSKHGLNGYLTLALNKRDKFQCNCFSERTEALQLGPLLKYICLFAILTSWIVHPPVLMRYTQI